MVLGVRAVILVTEDHSAALLDRQVSQAHRDEGLGQTRIGAGDVAEIGIVLP